MQITINAHALLANLLLFYVWHSSMSLLPQLLSITEPHVRHIAVRRLLSAVALFLSNSFRVASHFGLSTKHDKFILATSPPRRLLNRVTMENKTSESLFQAPGLRETRMGQANGRISTNEGWMRRHQRIFLRHTWNEIPLSTLEGTYFVSRS